MDEERGQAQGALSEAKEKAGIKVLTRGEYEKILPKAIEFFEAAEKAVKAEARAET